jgi:predicted metal-dependent hydrolase
MEKIYSDPDLGNIIFRKRKGIRRMSIRVHPLKGVSVTVPYLVPYATAQAFFKLKREWVIRTVARQQERCKSVQKADPQQVEAMRRQAKAELPGRLAELAARYGFSYNRVTIKHNSTNWGSCSTRNNINLNLNIVRLPAPLRDYILLHELCHLRHHDHGQAFHLLLEHVCTDNLLKLCETVPSETSSLTGSIGDAYSQAGTPADVQFARNLARAAAVSKARYPIDHVCTKAIKQYPLI